MKRNVGSADRTIRIIVGLGAIAAGIAYGSWWGAIGAVPLVTGLIGWCPPYSLLGISTSRTAS